MLAPSSWLTFLHLFEPCFTTPGMLLFEQLVTAWAVCPGRRTLTRIWSVIPAERRRRYGAYARWVREGTWSPDELGRLLVAQLVEHWAPTGRVILLLDDTLVNKSERGRRGRPRTKGERLAKPLGLAAALTDADWTTVQVLLPRSDGRTQALVARGPVVRDRPLSTPHARHRLRPTGHQYDDFFITSDTTLTPAEVAEL